MVDNEDRADWGEEAVTMCSQETRVYWEESVETSITDTLSYIAHFCERCGLDPAKVFESALRSHEGDYEDGPAAEHRYNPEEFLCDLHEGEPA
jgi:hypothetical protein